tara:strand:- start:512 stop:622 length:111 start_codon:yes stop_codon:yes gene_type:complete
MGATDMTTHRAVMAVCTGALLGVLIWSLHVWALTPY